MDDRSKRPPRSRVLATPQRTLVGSALVAGLSYAIVRNLGPALAGDAGRRLLLGALVWTAGSLAFWSFLRGQEARLETELRVARAGSAVQRSSVLRRRGPGPFFLLMFFWHAAVRVLTSLASTRLGYAAVLLAEGDAPRAKNALGIAWPWSRLGTLGGLREVVQADLLRAEGTEASLAQAIKTLYAMDALENRVAERYRIHVLVKALLEQADALTGRSIADELATSPDEELRVYAVWLKVWFDLDHLPLPSEPDIRRAMLLAKTHGADDLVKRLEALLAPASPGG